MTYLERIMSVIRSQVGDLALTTFGEAIEKELQNELYLVDQCLAMVDPSQPEYVGECPICGKDISQDSDETHTDECALAAVIIAQGEKEDKSVPAGYHVQHDQRFDRWYASFGTHGLDENGETFDGLAIGADRVFTSAQRAIRACRKHSEKYGILKAIP